MDKLNFLQPPYAPSLHFEHQQPASSHINLKNREQYIGIVARISVQRKKGKSTHINSFADINDLYMIHPPKFGQYSPRY
jgi:hypothetical protein